MTARVILGRLLDDSYRLRSVIAGGNLQNPTFSQIVYDSEMSAVRIVQSGSGSITAASVVTVPITDLGYVPFVLLSLAGVKGFCFNGVNVGGGSGQGNDGHITYVTTNSWLNVATGVTAALTTWGFPAGSVRALVVTPHGLFSDDMPDGGSIFGPDPYWDPFKRYAVTADLTRTELRIHVPLRSNNRDTGETGFAYTYYYHVLNVATG